MRIEPEPSATGKPVAIHRLFLPGLLTTALALRLLWWLLYVREIENEGVEYVRLAFNWFHGNGYVSIFGGTHTLFPPFYPLLIGLVTPIAGSGEAAARLVSIASGVLLVWVLFRLAYRLFDPTVAIIAGLITALHPLLIGLSVSTYSEAVYASMAASAALATVCCLQTGSWSRAALAGVLVGAAYLTRPEGLALAPLLAAVIFIANWRRGRFRSGVWQASALAGATLLIGAPYMARLSTMAGSFRWEGKSGYINLTIERFRSGLDYQDAVRGLDSTAAPAGPYMIRDQSEMMRREGGGMAQALQNQSEAPIRRMKKVVRLVLSTAALGGIPIILLAGAGLFLTGWWRREPEGFLVILIGPLLTTLALMTLDWLYVRYLFPLLPALMFLASAGAGWIGRRSRVVAVGLVLLALVQSARGMPRVFDLTQTRDTDMRIAGEWMRVNYPEAEPSVSRPLIMGIRLSPALYAEGEIVYLPWAEEERALRFVHRVAPDYVMIRETEAAAVPYGSQWLANGIGDPCATPVTLPPEASPYRVWRWTCKPGNSER